MQRDAHDLLAHHLALPPGIASDSRDDLAIRSEAGLILGCTE